MNTFARSLRLEFRVCFSRQAQPLWFRILKWTVGLAFIARYHSATWFWPFAAAYGVATLALHFFYRWKTRAWSRPWGGWNDVRTADGFR